MSITFTKLFASITESTVWCEPDRVRIVWITMLAMADRHGRVFASIPGLANRARVPVEDAEQAIERFLAPDKYSRTPAHDGRRIEPIDGGWRLLNHEKYRSIRDEEAIKESKRRYINGRRAAERAAKADVAKSGEGVEDFSTVDRSRHNAEAEADADAETVKKDLPGAVNQQRNTGDGGNPPTPLRGNRRSRGAKPPTVLVGRQELVDRGVREQDADAWLAVRKAKKAPLTLTALEAVEREAKKVPLTLAQAVRQCAERNWQGFRCDWYKNARAKEGDPNAWAIGLKTEN